MLLYQILAYTIHEKIEKSHIRTINLKYQLQHEMKNLNYLMDHILYQIFKIILSIFKKKRGEETDNSSIEIYGNKIKNRITFKIKTRYYLELLTPETIKLLGNNRNKIAKGETGEKVPHLEITEVVLGHSKYLGIIVNNYYLQNSRVLYTFVPNNY